MFRTLRQLCAENWQWRRQVWNLAKIDLVKTYRGAALGKIWLFVKPAVYILVFWVALEFGLRSSSDVNGKPYLLWLSAGVFPWFFMSDMISTGSDVYRRYPYLVNRIKFPLSLISTFYTLSLLIIFSCMMGFTIVVCAICGIMPSVYLLQLPLVMAFMFVFWVSWSMALSPLSAISRDFSNLLKTLGTPFFWLSGILFDIGHWPRAARLVASFNPVTWVVQSVRDCFVYDRWFWADPESFLPFLAMLLVFVLLALHNYGRLYTEVPDVL
ncbi:ABC transporter permease [Bifidobacterium amazonense]|uniref:Transport permease protein n=1 Tax=Bifidobacterium amazonense TaxID=2809027 RepID=A0ABS9VU80_9BIFI|nr:ABC transporter permease [Bifidobacterium amazonense]MCH9275494.1 ABC transporter permease [Bifidobacterium amazonense]